MKKIIVIAATLLFYSHNSTAQVHKNGVGLRIGERGSLNNPSLSYQFRLNDHNRLQLGLNYRQRDFQYYDFRRLSTSLYFQHVWNIHGGLNWYLGAGIKHELIQHNQNGIANYYHTISAGPTIGLEYDFNHKNVPLVLAIDYRPSLIHSPSTPNTLRYQNHIGLSLHYTFGDKKKLKKD
jgi:hypothetical protein